MLVLRRAAGLADLRHAVARGGARLGEDLRDAADDLARRRVELHHADHRAVADLHHLGEAWLRGAPGRLPRHHLGARRCGLERMRRFVRRSARPLGVPG
ncbi:MAG: hypothetical protein R3B72_39205 [Polyangiaceae bacterium]